MGRRGDQWHNRPGNGRHPLEPADGRGLLRRGARHKALSAAQEAAESRW